MRWLFNNYKPYAMVCLTRTNPLIFIYLFHNLLVFNRIFYDIYNVIYTLNVCVTPLSCRRGVATGMDDGVDK